MRARQIPANIRAARQPGLRLPRRRPLWRARKKKTTTIQHLAMDALSRSLSDYQLALRVVYELLEDGPGNAAQLAERLTEKDEDGSFYSEQWVNDAISVLDVFSLLDFDGLAEDDPVRLRRLRRG
jgi:hypothetical protein